MRETVSAGAGFGGVADGWTELDQPAMEQRGDEHVRRRIPRPGPGRHERHGALQRRRVAILLGRGTELCAVRQVLLLVQAGERANRNYWVSGGPPPSQSVTAAAIDQPTIFDSLQKAGVSWKFYVQDYQPDKTYRAESVADPTTQPIRVPLLNQDRFIDDPELRSHIVDLTQYYADLSDGTLPSVAYVASYSASERSARSVQSGQDLARNMVTQLMLSDSWPSSAFLISYDGPGGWFDHVAPPQVDADGYGLRVPALLISPYALRGAVNHAVLDATSALRFIQDNWRLSPLTTRDGAASSIAGAFDFGAAPRAAQLLPVAAVESGPPVGAVGAVYWTYGSAAAVIALMLIAAAVSPWIRRRLTQFGRGQHRLVRPRTRSS